MKLIEVNQERYRIATARDLGLSRILNTHPELIDAAGNWIGTFYEFAMIYHAAEVKAIGGKAKILDTYLIARDTILSCMNRRQRFSPEKKITALVHKKILAYMDQFIERYV